MSILTKFVTDTDLARRLAEYRGQPSFRDNCAAKYKATSKFAPNYVNVRFSSKLLDMPLNCGIYIFHQMFILCVEHNNYDV